MEDDVTNKVFFGNLMSGKSFQSGFSGAFDIAGNALTQATPQFSQALAAKRAAEIIKPGTQHEEIDITEMEQFRSSLYDYYTGEKIKVTPLAFIAKALVSALKEFPNFNASIDTESNKITYKKYFHIGFAVDTPHGLMVPKIRNVDQMNIVQQVFC